MDVSGGESGKGKKEEGGCSYSLTVGKWKQNLFLEILESFNFIRVVPCRFNCIN